MLRNLVLTALFSVFSLYAMAQYPFDDQIIQDAGNMAATGQGSEIYTNDSYQDNPSNYEKKQLDKCMYSDTYCSAKNYKIKHKKSN